MRSPNMHNPKGSLPATQTKPSLEISRPFLSGESLDRLRSQLAAQEAKSLQSLLSSLGAVERPAGGYEHIKKIEHKDQLIYLGHFNDAVQYLPASLTRQQVIDTVSALTPQPTDSPAIRAALFEIWLTTKHEKMPPEDRNAMLKIYADRLSVHDPSHVALVLAEISETEIFFPAWAEIQKRLNSLQGWRAKIKSSLRLLLRKLSKE